jgi:pimeloyl-ACP methyl ester carboxylesterase
VGFSLGAQLALRLAADRPDLVRRVVVISAQTLPLPFERATLAALSAAAPLARQAWFARLQAADLGVPADLVPEYVSDSVRLSRETLLDSVAANLRFRLPAGWARYPGPAVVLVGGRERPVMQKSARATHDALPGSVFVRVDGAGHDLPFSRPDLVAAGILGRFSGEGQP